ncbi:MAG: hypothetical protein KJZ76_03800 [Burkholderiaceae bacterium]|nr:hypothetical protein [Burkholderiaceae bacterium]
MAEWNRDIPWRQGHLLGSDAIAALGLNHTTEHEHPLVIVASHDCDLAQAPEREPVVEVLVGCTVASGQGNYTHAKTARKLHIEFEGQILFWAEFEATAKVAIDKVMLNAFAPRTDAHLSSDKLNTFQLWLASRYRRSAFPDEFDRRLKDETLAEKISKAVRKHGDLISGVFFDVDDGDEVRRVDPDDAYTLDIYVLHPDEPDYMAAAAAAEQVVKNIHAAFITRLFEPTKTWKYIELRACEVLSESGLTYQQFKMLKRWPLDHISLAADPQQPVLAE